MIKNTIIFFIRKVGKKTEKTKILVLEYGDKILSQITSTMCEYFTKRILGFNISILEYTANLLLFRNFITFSVQEEWKLF